MTPLEEARQTVTQKIPWVLWWKDGDLKRWTRWHFEDCAQRERRTRNMFPASYSQVVYDPDGELFPLTDPNAPEWMK